MSWLHEAAAYGAAALTVGSLAVSVLASALGRASRLWLDRLILLTVVGLLLAAASGLPLVVLVGPPADVLHLLYGFVAPLILLAGRYLGRHGPIRRRALFVALASLALLGVVYRLFTTAGPAG